MTWLEQIAASLTQASLWLTIVSIIFIPLERLFPLHRARILRRGFGRDIAYNLLNAIVPSLLLGLPLIWLVALGRTLLPDAWLTRMDAVPFWMRTLAGFAIGDVGAYLGHRLAHHVPLAWRFHAVHHAAEQLDYLVDTRGHPVDTAFLRIFAYIPAVLLGLNGHGGGVDPVVTAALAAFATIWSYFIHANIRWRFGPLEWLITTPAFHHWHHTLAPADRNFASYFPVIDWVFGTLYLPKQTWPERYGIPTGMTESLEEQLIQPFLGRWQTNPAAPIDPAATLDSMNQRN